MANLNSRVRAQPDVTIVGSQNLVDAIACTFVRMTPTVPLTIAAPIELQAMIGSLHQIAIVTELWSQYALHRLWNWIQFLEHAVIGYENSARLKEGYQLDQLIVGTCRQGANQIDCAIGLMFRNLSLGPGPQASSRER